MENETQQTCSVITCNKTLILSSKGRDTDWTVPEETLFLIKAINPSQSLFTVTRKEAKISLHMFFKKCGNFQSKELHSNKAEICLQLCFSSQSHNHRKKTMISEFYMFDTCKNENILIYFGNGSQHGNRSPERQRNSLKKHQWISSLLSCLTLTNRCTVGSQCQ